MPFLFLSPSTQYFNPYITTGDERYWMNALADEMTPYLHASGITVTRNDPDGSAAQSIRDSNASRQDFHLALHSNAAPQALSGRLRGVDIYYYPTSEAGLRMANILVDNIKPIYPLPDRVQARSSTIIGELRRTRAPAVLTELGYHDNTEDANWLTGNLDAIARALAGHPSLLLADEPTGALDRATGRQVMSLFHDLNDEGRTIIMITHDIEIARHARRIVRILDGEISEGVVEDA